MAETRREALCIQPHSTRTRTPPALFALSLERGQAFLDRGGRIRTLYQHTLRHAPTVHTL